MLTEVKSVNEVIYLIDEDNQIHSVKCSDCNELKTLEDVKNTEKGICSTCSGEEVSEELEVLDMEMKKLITQYKGTDKLQRNFQLDKELSSKLDNLQRRYGHGFKSALFNKLLANAIDQMEVECNLDLNEKLPRLKGVGVQ